MSIIHVFASLLPYAHQDASSMRMSVTTMRPALTVSDIFIISTYRIHQIVSRILYLSIYELSYCCFFLLFLQICDGNRDCDDGSDEGAMCNPSVKEIPSSIGYYVAIGLTLYFFLQIIILLVICKYVKESSLSKHLGFASLSPKNFHKKS